MGKDVRPESWINCGDGKTNFVDANGIVIKTLYIDFPAEDFNKLKSWISSIIATVERETFARAINGMLGMEAYDQASYQTFCGEFERLRTSSPLAIEVLNLRAGTLVEKARLLEEEAASQEELIRAKRKEAAAATEAANLLISIANELEGK